MARELDDAILTLRTNELELGLWIIKTTGNPDAVLAIDEFILKNQDNWFVREVLGMMRRTFARLDVTSRSMYAIIEPGSCFAGTLAGIGAGRGSRLHAATRRKAKAWPAVTLSEMNFGALPMVNRLSRLAARFYQDDKQIEALREHDRTETFGVAKRWTPGWSPPRPMIWIGKTKLRQAIESRAALSPDALTGLEANLRFGLPRDAGDARFWPAFGLAELDFHSPQRGGSQRRAESLRHRHAGEIQLGKSLAAERGRSEF